MSSSPMSEQPGRSGHMHYNNNTVKLPHASGHSSSNCQGHVTKIKMHRFEIFVALRFING